MNNNKPADNHMDKLTLSQDEDNMRVCTGLVKTAGRRGDSPAGSVIVLDGVIISEGIKGGKTHQDITFYAESEAIRHTIKHLGKQDLSDCIMCSYMIRHCPTSDNRAHNRGNRRIQFRISAIVRCQHQNNGRLPYSSSTGPEEECPALRH